MTKQFQKIGLALILLTVGLSSCVNLKHVNDFSSSSLKSIKKFEEINYTFKQNCLDNCQDKKINDLSLSTKDCDCKLNEKADSVTLLIYNSVQGYLDGLTNLSNNDLTSYKMDTLTKALTEGDFGSIKIEKEQVEAYSKISKILLKAFTDEYRKKKIKEYVKDANQPIKVLITFLDFNLSANLVGKLNVQKQRIERYYFDLTKDPTLSTIEKRKAVEEWVYDYNGYYIPNWVEGVNQIPAIVGSVIRTEPHGQAKAGVVASFIMVKMN
uniref:hypothetical protein n=1 Tax=Roseivirga sp. TaxID=1964215 RepID=UPI0040475111